MSLKMNVLLSCLFTALVGCTTRAPEATPSLQTAETALASANYPEALKKFRDFQKQYRNSKFLAAARLGEAQSLEGLEQFAEAEEIYRSVYDISVREQPEIAAQALYRLSYCYEALGEQVKAVASLRDSLQSKQYLPDEVTQAEIPARLAMLYNLGENIEESTRYFEIAEKGISKLQGRSDIPALVLAKAYLQMGSVSLNQISTENFQSSVSSQKIVQRYLFKAIHLSLDPYSTAAATKLTQNYRDFWNTIIESYPEKVSDAEARLRASHEFQITNGTVYLGLIEDAELYRPLVANKMNSLEKDFFAYLAETKKRTQALLYRHQGIMALTEESSKLNGIKRPGRIKAKESLVLPQNKTADDPNL